MKKILILILLLGYLAVDTSAQESDKAAIEEVITTLFDGMRIGDSSMVASAFHKEAPMHTVYTNREGNVVRGSGSLDSFLNAIGSPRENIWDEQILSVDVRIDADLASVWTPYKFFIDDTFSHCGVNSFQMAKLEGNWKIIYIVDTRRGSNCIGD